MSEVTDIKKQLESEIAVDNDDGNSTCSEFERVSHKDNEEVISADILGLDDGQKTPTDSVMNFGTFQNFEQIRNELVEIRKEVNANSLKIQQLLHVKEMDKLQADLAAMKLKKSEDEKFAKILKEFAELREEVAKMRVQQNVAGIGGEFDRLDEAAELAQRFEHKNGEIVLVNNSDNDWLYRANPNIDGDCGGVIEPNEYGDHTIRTIRGYSTNATAMNSFTYVVNYAEFRITNLPKPKEPFKYEIPPANGLCASRGCCRCQQEKNC